jgi:hypothetical protein
MSLRAGSRVDVRQVGPPVGGVLALWDAANARTLWRVDRPEELADRLGRGVVSRTRVEPRRYREVGLFDPDASVLVLTERVADEDVSDATSVGLRGSEIGLTPADPGALSSEEAWTELAAWLGLVYEAAAARREFVVVELGGWEAPPTPFVFSLVSADSGAGMASHLEASPPPVPPTIWPVRSDPGAEGVTMRAPARPDTIRVGGHLAVDAARRWAESPHDLGVTFGTIPED